MGMDVYGTAPKSERGKYFRCNVWHWRPLAEFALVFGPKEITSKCKYWQSNDGAGLGAADSITLGKTLLKLVSNGVAAQYVSGRDAMLERLPDEPCTWCEGTGVRRDAIGVANGNHVRVIDEVGHPRYGKVGWCNACNGIGHKRPFETSYPLAVKTIEEFAHFLMECGGFKIC